MAASSSCYRFGPFELQPSERQLLMHGAQVSIGPRALDVLIILAERSGHLVTKSEMLDRVWQKVVVEENTLQAQIASLRKVLGQDAIATVFKRGYRFTLDVKAYDPVHSAPRHNLPAPVASFVGRDQELDEVRRLTQQHRLVTLTGVGGIGKTQLALRLAAGDVDKYPGGVWFVDLASVSDPRLVIQAVTDTIGVTEQSARSVRDSLVTHVAGQEHALVILDNCEHLLVSCADVTRLLLQASPKTTILATSREPLHVIGEASYQVKPLDAPDLAFPSKLSEIQSYSAVRLFLDRAMASEPGFTLSESNVAPVARICRELDGIPLALELAAALVRSLPVFIIALRLSDRFRLLRGGDLSAVPRQQTLRSAIDWSYELLDVNERALFNRLGVFAGGFNVDAAEAVGAGSAAPDADTLDLLGHLVDKSLVTLDVRTGRYRLLETVRQYALGRLAADGSEDATRDRHLAFYVALAKDAASVLIGPEQLKWFGRLDDERENILSALLHYARASGSGTEGLAMLRSLHRWLGRSHLEMWHRVVIEALASPAAQEESLARAGALHTAAYLAYLRGHYEECGALAEASLRIALPSDDTGLILDARNVLGAASLGLKQFDRARDCFFQSLGLALVVSDFSRGADARLGLGEAYAAEGQFALAHPHYVEALARYRANGESDYLDLTLGNLARNSLSLGDVAGATEYLMELNRAGHMPYIHRASIVLETCAGIAVIQAAFRTAARFLGAQDGHHKRTGTVLEAADATVVSAIESKVRSALSESAYAEALSGGRDLNGDTALAEAFAWLNSLPRGRPNGPG